MKNLKVKVYGVFKVTKKQFLIVEAIFMAFFIGMAIFTFLHYDKPAESYDIAYDRWAANYSIYMWFGFMAMVVLESQFYLHRFTKAQLNIIEEQKEEIETQKDEIEAQRDLVTIQKERIENINKEITDSIHYAKRIQKAILPSFSLPERLFEEYFIFFRPKDIVSGDFYWMTEVKDKVIVAAADCTGHGVPGAFMSMLGAAYLNEIVNKGFVTHPGKILESLRKEVVEALHQRSFENSTENKTSSRSVKSVKDGMDIALCTIDKKTRKLEFAGANNPVYIIQESTESVNEINDLSGKRVLTEIKGDKMPIGVHEIMDEFICHGRVLDKNASIYMFSDGFADQFGGTKPGGKKFKYKPFKSLLLNSSHLTLPEQMKVLEKTIDDWMQVVDPSTDAYHQQVDDICVIGFRI